MFPNSLYQSNELIEWMDLLWNSQNREQQKYLWKVILLRGESQYGKQQR